MILLLLLVTVCRAIILESPLSKTQLARAYKFGEVCPEYNEKDNLLLFKDVHQKEKGYVNFTEVIKEDIIGKIGLHVDVTFCEVKEAPDSCKKFLSYKTSNWCSIIVSRDKTTVWNDWDSCIQPPVRCPIKKGISQAINCDYTMQNFNMFPKRYGNYRIKFKLLNITGNTANVFCCADFEFDIIRRK